MLLRNQISQATLLSSSNTRWPFASIACRTVSGTEASVKGPSASTVPVCPTQGDAMEQKRIIEKAVRLRRTLMIRAPILFTTETLRHGEFFQQLSSCESTHKCTALAVQVPGNAEPRAAIGICQRHRRHRMRHLREWWIERNFVSAKMIFVADGAGLHGDELPGAQHGGTVVLSADHQFHGYGKYLFHIL